jgi:hypothetical protein
VSERGRDEELRHPVHPVVAGDWHRDPCGAARSQILYWANLGFALPDRFLPQAQQRAAPEEMLRMASR